MIPPGQQHGVVDLGIAARSGAASTCHRNGESAMIYTKSGSDALAKRVVIVSPGTGNQHWGTTYFGPRSSSGHAPGPQATMSELRAHESVVPHFHGVSMFQLFIAGSGTIGNRGQELKPLTVQFKDHHTAYGPITAG